MNAYDLFISYSVKDSEIAEQMVECFERRGLRCWIAPRNIMHGGMWAEEIVEAISQTKGLVLIYSKNAYASSQVPKEVGLATSNKKRIFPFCIDDTPLKGSFLYHLSDCQLIQAQADRKQKAEELAEVLQTLFCEETEKPFTESAVKEKETEQIKDTQLGGERKRDKKKPDQKNVGKKPSQWYRNLPGIRKKVVLATVIAAVMIVVVGWEVWFVSSRKIKVETTGGEVHTTEYTSEDTFVTITGKAVDEKALQAFLQMPELQSLRLENADLNNDSIKIIAGITGLTSLYIADNPQVTDIAPLAGLEHLERLDISGTGVLDAGCLKNFSKLDELHMNRMPYLSADTVACPPDIRKLECADNTFETLDFLQNAELPKLSDLNCCDNQISDIGALAEFPELCTLNISGNQISDIGALEECYCLRDLNVSYNLLSGIEALSDSFSLTNLDISGNQITDLSPIATMEKLQRVDMAGNGIEDITPLGENKNLLQNTTRLDISQNRIKDITVLAKFTELTSLDVYDNQVSDISPLAECRKLTTLDLSDNQVADLSALAELSTLNALYVLHNPVKQIDGGMIVGRGALNKAYLFVSYEDSVDWVTFLEEKPNDWVVRIYDVPEKEQRRIREKMGVRASGIEFRDYESYLDMRRSD